MGNATDAADNINKVKALRFLVKGEAAENVEIPDNISFLYSQLDFLKINSNRTMYV